MLLDLLNVLCSFIDSKPATEAYYPASVKVFKTAILHFLWFIKNHKRKSNNSKHDFSFIQLHNQVLPTSLPWQVYDPKEQSTMALESGQWIPNVAQGLCVGLFWFALYPKAISLSMPKQAKDCYHSLRMLHQVHDHLFSKIRCLNKNTMPGCFSSLKNHGYVGKPLWRAHTNAACKPVVNNRCLIVSATVLGSFRESTVFSRPWWLTCRMLNWFMLLSSWVYDHMFLFVFVWV